MEVARNPFCSPWPHPWRPPPAGWAIRRGDHGTDQEEGQAEVESARPASEPSGPGLPRNPRREVVNSDEPRLKTLAACSLSRLLGPPRPWSRFSGSSRLSLSLLPTLPKVEKEPASRTSCAKSFCLIMFVSEE